MSSPLAHLVPTCFVEADPQLELTRRATIECIGTLLLTTVAAGAGLAVTQVEPGNHGFALLLSALVTSGALVGLILALGKVSGGHFNPLITLLQWISRERNGKCTVAYVAGQLIGAALGAAIANMLFPTPSVEQAMATPIATPSGSYANPAITVASLIAHGPVHLSVRAVWLYVPAELLGAVLAILIIAIGYPRKRLPDAVEQPVDRAVLQR